MMVSSLTDVDGESVASNPAPSSILVVDDEEMVRDVVVRYLEHAGMVAHPSRRRRDGSAAHSA